MSARRARAWSTAMTASPGPLELRVSPEEVEGVVPPSLRGGRLLSNGPGWTRIGGVTAHPFDGHGYVRSFSLEEDGGVRLTAAFVKTPSYLAEQEASRLLHRGLGTNPSPSFWQNMKRGPARNVANTTIMRWGDALLAGWEAGAPHALDPETLETKGEEDFGGLIAGQATLAHMREDRSRGRLTLCSVAQGRQTTFTFREVDQTGALLSTSVAKLDGMLFTHDYALTDSWFVLGGNPLRLKPWQLGRALLGAGTLIEAVTPDARKPGVLHLVPRGVEGPVRTIELPEAAFVVHFGNAFEEDGAVTVDACVFSRFAFGQEFGYRRVEGTFDPSLPEARGPQQLLRITIPPDSDRATVEPLTRHGVDFPRFHPDHEGRPTPMLFGATRRDTRYSDPFDSIIAIDLLDPERPEQLWTAPDDVFVGEPIYVPDQEDEARGHVLALLSDGLAGTTTLVVLESDALSKGPVASVRLPLLPVAFHGCWDRAPA